MPKPLPPTPGCDSYASRDVVIAAQGRAIEELTAANARLVERIVGSAVPSSSSSGTRFHDLGSDLHDNRNSPDRRKRNHVRELEALGFKVTLEPAA